MRIPNLFSLIIALLPTVSVAQPQEISVAAWTGIHAKPNATVQDFSKIYAADAKLTVADAIEVGSSPWRIANFYESEKNAFTNESGSLYQPVWSLSTDKYLAVVERVSGTQTGGWISYRPGMFAAVNQPNPRIGYYRLNLMQKDSDGKIASQTIAFDENTLFNQIGNHPGKFRSQDEYLDFGSPTTHTSSTTTLAKEASNKDLAVRFDDAFARNNLTATLSFLAQTASIADVAFPISLPNGIAVPMTVPLPFFEQMLNGFYQLFEVVKIERNAEELIAADNWVLDVFRWTAKVKSTGQTVQLTDYVLLQFQEGKIIKSITFKNGYSLDRQLSH